MALALALTAWLALAAGTITTWPVIGMGVSATVVLAAGIAVRRAGPIAPAIVLLGGAYALILAVDEPLLDMRAAVVGATLLAIAEFAYRSLEARDAAAEDGGAVATRVGWIAAQSLVALLIGGALLGLIDVVRGGGLAVELVGTGAAVAAAVVLARAAIAAQGGDGPGRDRGVAD